MRKTRKYDIITTPAERVEMAPLNEGEDDEDDSTLFDIKYRLVFVKSPSVRSLVNLPNLGILLVFFFFSFFLFMKALLITYNIVYVNLCFLLKECPQMYVCRLKCSCHSCSRKPGLTFDSKIKCWHLVSPFRSFNCSLTQPLPQRKIWPPVYLTFLTSQRTRHAYFLQHHADCCVLKD